MANMKRLLKKPQAKSTDVPQPQIKPDVIKKAVEGVIKFASENPHLQNNLFKEEFPLFLQLNSIKIPRTKGEVKHLFRIPLKNPLLPHEADVCIIVPDVKGIPNKEHDRHLEHYETLLSKKGVAGIKKIMTFHEFRTEYDTFELKNRLADLYDIFLVDGKISGKVVHKCGKVFYKKRKVPIPIKLQASKLKLNIEQALKRTYFLMNFKSDSQMIQFGHSKMKTKMLVENILSLIEFIQTKFPGKMENVRSLYVYAYRGSSIPIYFSSKNQNEVKVPIITGSETKLKTERGELTTLYNAEVVVKPEGHVVVKRRKLKDGHEVTKSAGDTSDTKQILTKTGKRKITNASSDESKKGEAKETSAYLKTDVSNTNEKLPKIEDKPSKKKKVSTGIKGKLNKTKTKVSVPKSKKKVK